MIKYYTTEAKQSAIDTITHLIDVIATAPGNVINYTDAHRIIDILADRRGDIEKDMKGDRNNDF